MKTKLLVALGAVLLTNGINAQVNSNVFPSTKNLYGNLKEVAFDTNSIMFGQEFYNTFLFPGNLTSNPDQSDCKNTTGKQPAVLGQDFQYYIDRADLKPNLVAGAKKAFSQGSVVEICWHLKGKGIDANYTANDYYLMYNIANNYQNERNWLNGELDKVVSILNNDLKIPVIVRLFHEMNGNWFWWGTQAYGGPTAYKGMYQYCVNYLKQRTNYALFAWTPGYPFTGTDNYPPGLNYYPGNSYVDVVGMDMYDQDTSSGKSFDVMVDQVTAVSDFAYSNNKIPILAETGNRVNSPDVDSWWWYRLNAKLQASNRAFKIAYMLTWLNTSYGNLKHIPYVPYYPGSSGQAVNGFNDFVNMPTILMQPGAAARNMYDYSYKTNNISSTSKLVANNKEDKTSDSYFVSIYPNPVRGESFSVNVGTSVNKDVTITVTDLVGHTVMTKDSKDAQLVTIPVSGLSKGIYLVKIVSDELNETQKVIIQ